MRLTRLAGWIVFMVTMPAAVWSAVLEITVLGVASDEGYIRVALYDKEDGYMNEELSVAKKEVKAQKGDVTVIFPELEPGTYAVTLYHDENSNEKLDKNFVRFPKEGYGFGNNARGRLGPPTFEATTVPVKGASQIKVSLTY